MIVAQLDIRNIWIQVSMSGQTGEEFEMFDKQVFTLFRQRHFCSNQLEPEVYVFNFAEDVLISQMILLARMSFA